MPLLSLDIIDPRAEMRYGKSGPSQQLDEITRDDDSGIPCFRAWRRLHVALACCHVPRDLAQAHHLLGRKDSHRPIEIRETYHNGL